MWYERCENPQAFERMYASPEGLDRVGLHEVVLRRDGGHLRLRVELSRFPDHPPERWEPEANRVQVEVDFWSIEDLKLEGWSHEISGLLTLSRAGDALGLAFESGTVRITARCELARIARFSAYVVAPPD